MSTQNPAAPNAKLQADPRYQAALATYRRAVANAPPQTSVNGQRNDDSGAGGGGDDPVVLQARRVLGQTAEDIVKTYGLSGQPQAWLLTPDGQLTYQEDHSGRNLILMMGGIGMSGFVPAGGGTALSELGPSTTANMALTTAAANSVPSSLAALTPAASSTFMGLTQAELTRYGLGTAGSLVNSYLQSRAAGNASDAQQKYLEEALAYQKEQDAYNRTRQTGLDAQDVARYGYTTATDAARYGDTQQEYLAGFAKDENRYAYATDLEASRYKDYSKRIAPYLASGASANDRAASLLGLPAGAAFDPSLTPGPTRVVSKPPTLNDPGHGFASSGGVSGAQASGAIPGMPAGDLTAQITAGFKIAGATPTADDIAYWTAKMPELNARGAELGDPTYAWKRILGWQSGTPVLAGPYQTTART